jgi:hypothetical protein
MGSAFVEDEEVPEPEPNAEATTQFEPTSEASAKVEKPFELDVESS